MTEKDVEIMLLKALIESMGKMSYPQNRP